jgi:hypothetical protein
MQLLLFMKRLKMSIAILSEDIDTMKCSVENVLLQGELCPQTILACQSFMASEVWLIIVIYSSR